MGRRKRDRRTFSLSNDVNDFLDIRAKTNDASATVDASIRKTKEFKNYIKEKINDKN